jgi:predicted RNA binding protein YcfA (HicA-like mRNA interferase family)
MPQGFYRDLVKILKQNGFFIMAGGKGSHEKWRNTDTPVTVTVPHNLNSRMTANAILKQAGLSKAF